MIKVKNLIKEYKIDKNNSEKVLKGIDLELKQGFNVLYGPSGCGKSTLLNIVSGLDTEYKGEILVDGANLRTKNLDNYHQNDIGFIFQTFNLINHLSILENIMIPLYLNKKSSKKKCIEKGLEALNEVGLKKYSNKLPTQLSGGQKQRVAIARALINNPSIIIADEPTGALDSKTGFEILDTLKKLSEYGKIVIVVTHDPRVSEYADRIYYLNDGLIEKTDVVKEYDLKFQSSANKNGLSFNGALKLAYKNFYSRFIRNVLVSLGSAIGIIGILLSLGLGNGIDNGIGDIFSSILSPNSINVSGKSESGKPNFGPPSIKLNQEEVDEVFSLLQEQNITEIYEDQFYNGVTLTYDEQKVYAKEDEIYVSTIQKLDYKDDRQSGYSVESDVLLAGRTIDDNVNEIYITKDLAAILLGITKEQVTSENAVTLVDKKINLDFFIKTDTKNQEYTFETKVAGVLNQDTFSSLIYASDRSVEEITSLTGQKAETLSITAYAKDSKQASEVALKYEENEKYTFSTLGDVLDQISALTAAITITLAFVAGLSLIVAAVMIAIVLYIGVIERTKEIGILRAVGYKAKNIRFLFLTEAIIIITISNIIAISLSYLIQIIANPKVLELSTFKNAFSITPFNIIIVYLITLIIAILAGIYPSNKASKVDPVESLRTE